jgi:hypothetical protein
MKQCYLRIVVAEDINNQILEVRKQGKFAGKPYQFFKHLVILGLREYQAQIKSEAANRETRLQAAGCETAPEAVQRAEAKIIPFPGVSLPEPDGFQNRLDAFLHEMGYIE